MASSNRLDTDFEFPSAKGVGELITQTFDLYFRNFQWVLFLALFFFSPLIVGKNIYFFANPPDSKLFKFWIDSIILGFPAVYTAPTLVYILVKTLREGKAPPFGDALKWGLQCFPRNFGYHFVTGFLTMLGFVLLIVPGIFVMLWYSLLSVVISVEGPEQANPMERSKALVKEHMGLLLGAGAVIFILDLLSCMMAGAVIGMGVAVLNVVLGHKGPFVATDHWVMSSLIEILSIMLNMNMGVLALCGYLSWSKEGVVEQGEMVTAVAKVETAPTPEPAVEAKYKPAPVPKRKTVKAKKASPKKAASKVPVRKKRKG